MLNNNNNNNNNNNKNLSSYINYNSRVFEKNLQMKLNIPNNNIYRYYIQNNYNNINK